MTTPAVTRTLNSLDPHWVPLALAVLLLLATAWESSFGAQRRRVSRVACLAAAMYVLASVALGAPFPFRTLAPTTRSSVECPSAATPLQP